MPLIAIWLLDSGDGFDFNGLDLGGLGENGSDGD